MAHENLIQYYVQRLASIYRDKPRASATVALLAKQMLADGLPLDIGEAFDIDLAVGNQLDVIGKYVGAPRDVGVEDTRPYFGFVGYDYPAGTQNPNGFVLYESLSMNAQGIWYEYGFTNQSTSQLTDYAYRQLLKLKVSTNTSNDTMEDIQNEIAAFFPGQLQVRDNQDMSMTYYFGSTFQLPLSVLQAYLPRPMGVKVTAVEALGFDVQVDNEPFCTSETPIAGRKIDFGSIQFADVKTVKITNAKTSSFNIIAITFTSTVFSVESISPSLPATLGTGDDITFSLKASSTDPAPDVNATMSVFIVSGAGLARYDFPLHVSIEGVLIYWMAFDNFDGYPNGPLNSPNDSWGWAQSGSTTQYLPLIIADNFDEYANGTLDAPNGGSNWAEAGTTNQYSNT